LNVSKGESQKEVNLYDFFHTSDEITCDSPHQTYPVDSQQFNVSENGNVHLSEYDTTYTHFTKEEEIYHICIAANVKRALPVFYILMTLQIAEHIGCGDHLHL
jgi:hypothetical protein